MAFIPNFDLIEQKLLIYGVSLREYIEGGFSLIGKIAYPSAIFDYNDKYRNKTDENDREVFLLIANAVLDACDHNIYHWASKLHATGFNTWQELVGSDNAKFFKLAMYAEIKTRSVSDNFPEFANASTVNFSNVNLQNNTSPPIFSTDLLSKDAMAYLDETSFNKLGDDVIEDPKEMEDWYLYRTLENILINESDGSVATVLNNKIIFSKELQNNKLDKLNVNNDFLIDINYSVNGDNFIATQSYKNPMTLVNRISDVQFPLATITNAGIMSVLDKKKVDSIRILFLGIFDTQNEFETLHPTGIAGEYCYVKVINSESGAENLHIGDWSVVELKWKYSDYIVGVETVTGDGIDNTDPINPKFKQAQADWNENDVNKPTFIKNKPAIANQVKMYTNIGGNSGAIISRSWYKSGGSDTWPQESSIILNNKICVYYPLDKKIHFKINIAGNLDREEDFVWCECYISSDGLKQLLNLAGLQGTPTNIKTISRYMIPKNDNSTDNSSSSIAWKSHDDLNVTYRLSRLDGSAWTVQGFELFWEFVADWN